MSYLSVKDVAEQLGVDIKTIYRLIRKGDLPAAKIGNLYRLRQSDVDSFVEQQFERTRQEIVQDEDEVEETSAPLRCESCFRLIKEEAHIGGVCEQADCEGVLCQSCVQAGRHYCRHHEPTPADKLTAARQAKAKGEINVLVTAVEARRRELNFRDRFDRKVQKVTAVTHPVTQQTIPIKNWSALHSRQDAAHQLAELHPNPPLSRLPLNIESHYTLPAAKNSLALHLIGRAVSRLAAHVAQEFDTAPLTAVDLLDLLLPYTQQAEKTGTAVVVGLASTTGWQKDAIQLLQGDERGEAWAHRLVFPCLIDLETRQLYASRADPALEPFLPLFTLPLPEEEVTAVEAYIRATLQQQSSLVADEVANTLSVTTGAVLTAYQRLVSTGQYFIEDIEGIGRVIAPM